MSLVVIHKSLHRPHLFLGCDRTFCMLAGVVAGITFFSGFTFFHLACGLVFWFTALFFLRRWAKEDPLFIDIWQRHLAQQAYYPARGSIWGPRPGQKSHWR